MAEPVWIFGYGSIVWRPAFDFVSREPAWLDGYVRRFWQASTDHRGVPEAPGRVVTLAEDPDGRCAGVVFQIAAAERETVLATLDHRESGGFDRVEVDVQRGTGQRCRATVYIAPPGNPNYLGPAPLDEIAAQIHRSCGPSGENSEYLLRLGSALRGMGAVDSHVEELALCLKNLRLARPDRD